MLSMQADHTEHGKSAQSDALETLLKKNIALSESILHSNKRIARRLLFMAVGNYVRLMLLLLPIILAIIFLPPFLKDFRNENPWLFNFFRTSAAESPAERMQPTSAPSGIDFQKIIGQLSPEQIKEIQKAFLK